MADTAELFVMNEDELETRLGESRRELLNLRFQLATGQLDNPARVGQVRKEVARVLTVLRQRELEEAALAAEAWDAGTAPAGPVAATNAPAATDVSAGADAPAATDAAATDAAATDEPATESDVEEG